MASFCFDFGAALHILKSGGQVRRPNWHEDRYIQLRPAEPEHPKPFKSAVASYIELCDVRGSHAPWTPTRCDLLEEDWTIWPS